MASLLRFKANPSKINDGSWVDLGEDFGNIGIKTRGFTDAYLDARQARVRRASMKFNGDVNKIPQADSRKILADLLVEFCLLDVRNLQDETGAEVSFDTFKELISEEAYQDLYGACLAAAQKVTNEREADLAEAKKN